RQLGVRIDQALREIAGMRGRVAHALQARDLADEREQLREIRRSVGNRTPPGVHVLAQERYFANTLARERRNLGDHVGEGTRHFLTARVGHDAEAAVLAAALHDRHVSASARLSTYFARRRQAVELLDERKADVDLRPARGAATLEKLQQPAERLRAEYHVDVRRACHDRGAFLARDAAADRDHEPGLGTLEMPHPA